MEDDLNKGIMGNDHRFTSSQQSHPQLRGEFLTISRSAETVLKKKLTGNAFKIDQSMTGVGFQSLIFQFFTPY